MNNRPKKPPVNIKELNGPKEDKHQPGALSYAGDEGGNGGNGSPRKGTIERSPGRGPVKGKTNILQMLLPVGLAVLASIIL